MFQKTLVSIAGSFSGVDTNILVLLGRLVSETERLIMPDGITSQLQVVAGVKTHDNDLFLEVRALLVEITHSEDFAEGVAVSVTGHVTVSVVREVTGIQVHGKVIHCAGFNGADPTEAAGVVALALSKRGSRRVA
ncbi:MAG: hypothetical protein ABIP54_03890 [Candidatus Andersenbacteria bacterium]